MNPYDELRLRDEVMYLHSLWHQGPPTPPPPNPIHLPNRTLNPNPIPSYIPQQPLPPHFHAHPWHLHHQQQQHTIHPPFAPAHTRSLPPVVASTAFKKRNNKKNKKKKKKGTRPDPPRSPGPEWPCPAPPDPPTTGWAASKPSSDTPPAPAVSLSPEERERLAALQAQNKASQAFREFLIGSDDDDEDDDDDDDDEDGLEEFEEFFVGVFTEEHELRRYYQRCFEGGEFCCLVCGAVGKKNSGKKYKDCVGLVQHSMSILRTEKKRAHRALGQAVCKVLGWDIDRLPTIVLKGEPLGCSLQMKPPEAEVETLQGEPKDDVAVDGDGKDGSDDIVVSLERGDDPVKEHAQGVDQSIDEGEHKEKADNDGMHKSDDKVVSLGHDDEPVEQHARGVDQIISECCSKEGDLNNVENLDEKTLDIGLKNGGSGAVDEGERDKPADGHAGDSGVNIIQEISGEPDKPADRNLAK